MAIVNPTTNFDWVLPEPGASVGAWGEMLNIIFGDSGANSIDSILKDASDKANAALPATGGTMTGILTQGGAFGGNTINVPSDATFNPQILVRRNTGPAGVLVGSAAGSDNQRSALFLDPGEAWGLAHLFTNSTIPFQIRRASTVHLSIGSTGNMTTAGDISMGGTLTAGVVPAERVSSGVLGVDRIPNLDAAKITTGTFPVGRIPDLPASKITSGTFPVDQIPNLNASKITAGTFHVNRIPNLNASKITDGAFHVDRIPNLNASKITAGAFHVDRIPNLDTAKITTGTFAGERISGGTATLAGLTNGSSPIVVTASSIRVPQRTTDPSDTAAGSIYFNTATGNLRVRDNVSWKTVTIS